MREEFSNSPPDGFVVFDDQGNEVRRWFVTARKLNEVDHSHV
jgi:hypothetical protein